MTYAQIPPLHIREQMARAFARRAAERPNPYDNDADEVVLEMIREGRMIFLEPDTLQLTIMCAEPPSDSSN